MSIPLCPVFRPSLKEMEDFQGYISIIRDQNPTAFIIKIRPPDEWTPRADHYSNLDVAVNHPVRQEIFGLSGKYQLALVSQRKLSLAQYRDRAQRTDKVAEGKDDNAVETLFWKSVRFSAPVYGSDTDVPTLFDSGAMWNLGELQTDLKRGLGKKALSGIITPYLYVGAWKTMFAWHCEDLNLPAINYLHLGKPKCWYAIDPRDAEKFEALARSYFPDYYESCKEFLRHKSTVISPFLLIKKGIRIMKAVQTERDFIIVFERVFHSGFNYGYNIAESVNFADSHWPEIGKNSRFCECEKGTVRINMHEYESNLARAKHSREERSKSPAKKARLSA